MYKLMRYAPFFAEPSTEIIGAPDFYVESGSTINLTCVVHNSPEPPAFIFWNHNNAVSVAQHFIFLLRFASPTMKNSPERERERAKGTSKIVAAVNMQRHHHHNTFHFFYEPLKAAVENDFSLSFVLLESWNFMTSMSIAWGWTDDGTKEREKWFWWTKKFWREKFFSKDMPCAFNMQTFVPSLRRKTFFRPSPERWEICMILAFLSKKKSKSCYTTNTSDWYELLLKALLPVSSPFSFSLPRAWAEIAL